MLLLFDSSTPQFISADILTFSSIVETKAPCLDSTLSQQLSSWLSPRHLRRQSRAGSPGHTREWPRADSYPKVFCSPNSLFNTDFLVGSHQHFGRFSCPTSFGALHCGKNQPDFSTAALSLLMIHINILFRIVADNLKPDCLGSLLLSDPLKYITCIKKSSA